MALFTRKDLNTADALHEARLAREEATRKEAEARSLFERLGSKLQGLQASLPELKAAIETAETERRKAVDLAALDKISPEDLASARTTVDEAKRTEEEAREMIDAVEANRVKAQQALSVASRNRQAAGKAFWC